MRPGPSRIIWKIFVVQNAELTCKSGETPGRSAGIIAPASFGRRREAAKREIGQRHFPPRPIFLPGFWGMIVSVISHTKHIILIVSL
jgi:hypothetical protein